MLGRGRVSVIPLQNVETFDDDVAPVAEDDLHLAAVHVDALAVEVLARGGGDGDGGILHKGSGSGRLDDDADLLDGTKMPKHLLNHVDGDGVLHV